MGGGCNTALTPLAAAVAADGDIDAAPEPVVLMAGDGGFKLTATELATLAAN
jgi:thiamine pyrophosphate-dependent acetolactate synthase large subunit-like protein